MKTFNQQAIEKINQAKSVKDIFNMVSYIGFGSDPNNVGKEVIEMIVENSNDFTKDIAGQWLQAYENDPLEDEDENGDMFTNNTRPGRMSDKQIWCLAYQVWNNKQVYLNH